MDLCQWNLPVSDKWSLFYLKNFIGLKAIHYSGAEFFSDHFMNKIGCKPTTSNLFASLVFETIELMNKKEKSLPKLTFAFYLIFFSTFYQLSCRFCLRHNLDGIKIHMQGTNNHVCQDQHVLFSVLILFFSPCEKIRFFFSVTLMCVSWKKSNVFEWRSSCTFLFVRQWSS